MRRIMMLIIALTMVFSLCSTVFAQESEWTGNVNFFLGGKTLDDEDWEPVEEQAEFGIEVDFAKKTWPVNIAIDLMVSAKEENPLGINIKGETSEFNVGVRKIFDAGIMHPFIGGGISFISAELSIFGLGVSGNDTGYWVDAGIYWRLTEHFNLGFEVKKSSADVTFSDISVTADGGGEHFGLLLGYHW
jgi:hypothetical protein